MQNKGLTMNECKPNCFEKTEAGGAFFIFHQITDEQSTKHEHRLRTTMKIYKKWSASSDSENIVKGN